MKKLFVFALALCLNLMACTNSDDDATPSSPNGGNSSGNNSSSTTAPQGDWKVTYFWDKDKEETSKFSGYSFVFESNGTLTASANGSSFTGTWSENSSGTRFNINITGSDALDELTDDWLLDEMTASRIKLKDDNDTHVEEIYLEKQ